MTDDQLIAKYGLKADKSSVDGLILFVKELLGESYSFDPIIATMENGVEENIRDYFVSMLYNQITNLSAGSVIPALNFVPTRINDKGRIVPNTANINTVMKDVDAKINEALLGAKGAINKVEDGNYDLSGIFTEDEMTALVDAIAVVIKGYIRTEENAIAAEKAVEYATPDTMKADIRNYVESFYYRTVINKIAPDDAGKVTLQIVTVSSQTNASIDLLVSLRADAYEYEDATKYEDIVTAMNADAELQALLAGINDSVKGAYGDVSAQLKAAFLKAFATKVLGKDKAPTLENASYDVEDAEGNKTTHKLREEAAALLEKLTATATEAEAYTNKDWSKTTKHRT